MLYISEMKSLSTPVYLVHLNLSWAFFSSKWSLNLRQIACSKSSHMWCPSSPFLQRVFQVSHYGFTLELSQSCPAATIFNLSFTYLDGEALKQCLREPRNFLSC